VLPALVLIDPRARFLDLPCFVSTGGTPVWWSPSSQRVRLISNGVFLAAPAFIILQPLFFPELIHETVTVELHKKVSIH
jgi:hypothetical protein